MSSANSRRFLTAKVVGCSLLMGHDESGTLALPKTGNGRRLARHPIDSRISLYAAKRRVELNYIVACKQLADT